MQHYQLEYYEKNLISIYYGYSIWEISVEIPFHKKPIKFYHI